ncbi:MAG: hypothetical protein V1867_01965 [Candidatus Falkowbacteria bacterium]
MFIYKKYFIVTAVFFLAAITGYMTSAQTPSPDTIAIRIIPNPEHYSARRWYKEKKFTGSPQSLTVDGYEAVRDGRTVYVNVANVAGATLYTNIYLISYNQAAENATVDIFGNMLLNWKFNTNYTVVGVCREHTAVNCFTDGECPANDVCDSTKARITRDTIRLSDIVEIKFIAAEKRKNGHYPVLGAGSYLPHRTISVWPSWQDTLGAELQTNLPVDPINRLGDCGAARFDPTTCWDEDNKEFASNLPDLPNNSFSYVYSTDNDGVNIEVCAVMEAGFAIGGAGVCALASVCTDLDGDGFCRPVCGTCLMDCDDSDPSVHGPSGAEICSGGLDEDCDGLADCNDPNCAGNPLCLTGPICGGNGCESALGETCATCPADCGACPTPTCGNGTCDSNECPGGTNPCPADCRCGNGSTECGEECDDGCNLGTPGVCEIADNMDGCSMNCLNAPYCQDSDGDGYGTAPYSGTVNGCSYNGDDCDDIASACGADCRPDNPTNVSGWVCGADGCEFCDEYDNDCDGAYNEDFTEENCAFVCLNPPPIGLGNASYNYLALRVGDLRCCGDDANEAGPYQSPETNCTDGRDNDCNGVADNLAPPLGPDPNCASSCFDVTNVGESFWYVWDQDPDCDQCDHDGDDDGNQGVSASSLDWITDYPGMADRCDPGCLSAGALVTAPVRIDDFQMVESRCNDLIDNDCDGLSDCADSDCASIPPCLPDCSGTPINTCMPGGAPAYCDSTGTVVESCGIPGNCGCTGSWVCGPLGTFCCDNICDGTCSPAGCTAPFDPDCGAGGCCGDGVCDLGESGICVADCPCVTSGLCDNNCPLNCTAIDDPDCSGTGCCGDGTCGVGETYSSCAGDCPCDNACNNVCSDPSCPIAEDPDCGCSLTANTCCPAACVYTTDSDCPNCCDMTFDFPCVFCGISGPAPSEPPAIPVG